LLGRTTLVRAITAVAVVAVGECVRARSQAAWDCTTTPRRFRAADLVLRPPRLRDAASWRRTRLANQRQLESAFPAQGPDWAAEQDELTWLERCLRLNVAARRGLAYPAVLVDVTAGNDPTVVGEIGIDAVDARTRTGELSAWTSTAVPSGRVVRWAVAEVLLRAFTAPAPLLRVVAPASTSNPGPEASLRALGFENELTLTDHRNYGGGPADHRIFVLHNNADTRAALQVMCAR
jgi:RimJ/RimL family protein N-acetyltransferase